MGGEKIYQNLIFQERNVQRAHWNFYVKTECGLCIQLVSLWQRNIWL